jgi:hypothetical protein
MQVMGHLQTGGYTMHDVLGSVLARQHHNKLLADP